MRRLAALALLALAALVVLRRRLARDPALTAPVAERPALPTAPSFLSVPWTLVSAADEQAELEIHAELPERLTLDRIDVQETPTQVFVTVLARPAAGERQPAADALTVALSRPLGARELIHTPADPPLYP